MGKVFFISDMHFNHTNIIKYCNRPFNNIDEMNETIIKNWNNTVSEDDKIFVLGDVGFFRPLTQAVVSNFVNQLNGRKHLICGNHDRHKKPRWWIEVGFLEATNHPILYGNEFILSHEPVFNSSYSKYINVHGHIHEKILDSKYHINICVEHTDYTPVPLSELRKTVERMKL